MDRKGQMEMVGLMLVAAIAVILGLAFYTQISKTVGDSTTTVHVENNTVTSAAVNATIELKGQAIVGTLIVYNATGGADISSNFTAVNGLGADGLTALLLKTGNDAKVAGQPVNVSYTFEPDGYISSSGGRSVALIIVIFAALAIAIVALEPTLRSGVLDLLGR